MNTLTQAHTQYKLRDGTVVPGVTAIISSQLGWNKNALIAWARREALAGQDPDKIASQAASIGSLTHYLVECHIKGENPVFDDYTKTQIDKAENGFLAYLDWESKQELEHLFTEKSLVSEKLGCGGTVDLISIGKRGYVLIDFKTSKGIYPDHKIQVAAYKNIYEEATGGKVGDVFILQLGKEDGSFTYHKLSRQEIQTGWKVFKHCLALYKLQKGF